MLKSPPPGDIIQPTGRPNLPQVLILPLLALSLLPTQTRTCLSVLLRRLKAQSSFTVTNFSTSTIITGTSFFLTLLPSLSSLTPSCIFPKSTDSILYHKRHPEPNAARAGRQVGPQAIFRLIGDGVVQPRTLPSYHGRTVTRANYD